jgi:16S rRNA (cytidine1402-2'-O)-methyltransferase
MVIDDYHWCTIRDANAELRAEFLQQLTAGNTVGILSEAGCPGVADPGQLLVQWAHEAEIKVRPLVGPNSMLLALMASGMNGQHFRFSGYLPIDLPARAKAIKELEHESQRRNCTQLFMETPYRNNQLMEVLVKTCLPQTRLCVAANLTGKDEFIKTKTIAEWKNKLPDLHKQPAVFLLSSSV